VPSIDHDHSASRAQEGQSDQTPAAVASEEESAARKTSGVETSHGPLVVAGVDGSAESLAAACCAEAVAEMRGWDLLIIAPPTQGSGAAARTVERGPRSRSGQARTADQPGWWPCALRICVTS
jgi:hypothetical protein